MDEGYILLPTAEPLDVPRPHDRLGKPSSPVRPSTVIDELLARPISI